MTKDTFDATTYVEQMLSLLQMPLPEEMKLGVVENFKRLQVIAEPVLTFPLGDEWEVAPTFEP